MANVSNDDYTTYNEYKAGVLIWKIVPPILILLGTVGNCLSIIVLTRRSIRSSTTALYLTVLAFSDLLVLYSGLLRQWVRILFETDVRHVSEFGCKLNIWLVYSSLDFSAWTLLLVTLERVVSAWLPHNARTLCTKKSAIALLISVGVFILLLNAHLLYGMVFKYSLDVNGNEQLEKCIEINDDYYNFFNITWPWIDLCAFCVIPFTVIVIGNGLILFKVLKSQKKVKSRVVPSVPGGSRQQTTSHGNKQSSMTAMLFTLNVVFLISTSPISIYNVGYTYWEKGATEHGVAQLDMWWAIVNMFMYINNSLNFLLYCLSGTKFRREVILIFTAWKRRTNTTTQMAHSNYSRTKFDTPSPKPTPRHSNVFTTNTPLPDLKPATDMNGLQNGLGNQDTEKNSGHSSNSLHPNDAVRSITHMSSFKGDSVKKPESSHTNSRHEGGETIVLDSFDGSVRVTCPSRNSDNEETDKPEGRDNTTDVLTDSVATEKHKEVDNQAPDIIHVEEAPVNDNNNINTQSDEFKPGVSSISSFMKSHDDSLKNEVIDSIA